jgi:hypothetical protein
MLRQSIDSILAQTHPVDQILVINDGSTDDTINVVLSYGDRLTLINKSNGGKASALNLALKHCGSDYVWICDDDDIAAADGVEHLADALDSNGDAAFAFGTYRSFSECKAGYSYWPPAKSGLEYEPNICIRFLENMFTYQYAMLVRRSAYDIVGPFREELIRASDYEMTIRLARSFTGVHVPKMIFYQRYHSSVRGTSTEIIRPEQRVSKQFMYDQKIFTWVRQDFSLNEFTPTFAVAWESVLAKRAALLERACVFAVHAMWGDAIQDFRDAAAISAIPAKPEELNLARRVIIEHPHAMAAMAALFENSQWCVDLKSYCASNGYCRNVIHTPTLIWLIRTLRTRNFRLFMAATKAYYQIFGVRGIRELFFGVSVIRELTLAVFRLLNSKLHKMGKDAEALNCSTHPICLP